MLKKTKKKNRRIHKTTFGWVIPGKGGKSTNFEIPEWMFKRELEEFIANGGVCK